MLKIKNDNTPGKQECAGVGLPNVDTKSKEDRENMINTPLSSQERVKRAQLCKTLSEY